MQNSKNTLKSPRWCQSLLVESGFGMRSRVFTQPGSETDNALQRLYVRFSNRPFGVKRFQTIHRYSVDVAHGLVLLFGIGTKALVWGFLCQGVRQGGEAFLRRFLGSISKPVSSSRPAHR